MNAALTAAQWRALILSPHSSDDQDGQYQTLDEQHGGLTSLLVGAFYSD
jgi:hypothetical protein